MGDDEIRASHIIIKHTGSRNPISRRTNEEITLSKGDALKEITALKEIVTPENFAEHATARSDCASCRQGGDLGSFGRGMMQKPFEDAAYALQVGEISGVVDSDSGLHLVLRTA